MKIFKKLIVCLIVVGCLSFATKIYAFNPIAASNIEILNDIKKELVKDRKYEYKIINGYGLSVEKLNELGEHGWKVCASFNDLNRSTSQGRGTTYNIILIREKR